MDKSNHFHFFADNLSADSAELDPLEANHAVSVLRLKPGDRITLTDGIGHLAEGVVESPSKRRVTVHIEKRMTLHRPHPDIRLCAGLPERDAFERILLDATALGVWRIVPVIAQYCQRKWWENGWEKHAERLRQKMITALKQSHTGYLPVVEKPRTCEEIVTSASGTLLVADSNGDALVTLAPIDANSPITCIVGPPGGLSPEETSLFEQSGFHLVRLASGRLRTELAATTFCAQITGLIGHSGAAGSAAVRQQHNQ